MTKACEISAALARQFRTRPPHRKIPKSQNRSMFGFVHFLGDLFISYLKRKAKVKNTSDLLPGHGGFLDRVDGIIFAIPIGILLFKLL